MEQDPPGDDELPTYDDLAALNGPNSRWACFQVSVACAYTASGLGDGRIG